MNRFPPKFFFGNRKSAIQNPKWLGLSIIAFVLVGTGVVAEAQQPGKIFRIGYLDGSTATGTAVLLEPFKQELSKLGWTEGKNIVIEYRFADQKPERLPEFAADLVRLKVDVIVVAGGPPTVAAKRTTKTTPIVMAFSGDPVAIGLVTSLAQPGGNVTGLAVLAAELNTKRLEILKDAVLKLTRVGVLALQLPESIGSPQMKELRSAARALKVELEEIETYHDLKNLEDAFRSAQQRRVNALMTTANRPFFAERKRIVEHAGKYRIPAIYPAREFIDDGGLMSYGADYVNLYRRVAVYVDKILKGTKPADLPVQQATKFEFFINLKAAKQIGLTIPINVLERANQVIR